MVKIRIYNRDWDKEIYKQFKKEIQKVFIELYPEIEEDVNLKVLCVNEDIEENYLGEKVILASTNGWRTSFTITIYKKAIERANNNIFSLYYTLYHELLHLYDTYHISSNKTNKVMEENPFANNKNFIIHLRMEFWNEFNAYSNGFVHFKNVGYPGFYKMLKSFNYLKNKSSSLKKEDVLTFMKEIDGFLYYSALYIAGKSYGKRKKKFYK